MATASETVIECSDPFHGLYGLFEFRFPFCSVEMLLIYLKFTHLASQSYLDNAEAKVDRDLIGQRNEIQLQTKSLPCLVRS